MKKQFRHIILLVGAFSFSTLCVGQIVTDGQHFRDSLFRHISLEGSACLDCHFSYAQGSSAIQPGLGSNGSELNKLDAFIHSAINHPQLFIERIRLTGYSSIEGSYSSNEILSRERVQGFYAYLREHYPEFYRYPHDMAWVAEDWNGLSKLVRSSNINEWEEILEIIRKVSNFDEREQLLVYLNGGRPYAQLERSILSQLRRVEIEVMYSTVPQEPDSGTLPPEPQPSLSETEQEDTLVSSVAKPLDDKAIDSWLGIGSIKQRADSFTPTLSFGSEALHPGSMQMGDYRFALKTNALLWAGVQHDFKYTTPVANVALEYYINRSFSVEAGAMYSYWRYNGKKEFQGISGYRLEPRYRFSFPCEWLEVYLGLYGRVGDYDRRKRSLTPALSKGEGAGKVTTSNYTGDYWDAGLSAGFHVHLIGGFGIEIGARAGYVKTSAIKYTQDNLYNWFESREKYNKIKVTDLNVSLVYRFR